MTHSELNAIPNPAEGLLVYCTDCGPNGIGSVVMCMAGAWHTLSSNCLNPLSPFAGAHVPALTQIEWHWNPVINAAGYKWNTINNYGTATDMGTNTSYTEPGLTCKTPYTRYVWTYSFCGVSGAAILSQSTSSTIIDAPASGIHVPSLTQITWNWNIVAGAAGYKWSTTDDFVVAVDMGLNFLFEENGLTCNTNYLRYVWAYGDCGNSSATTLTQSTLNSDINDPTAGIHVSTQTSIIWNWNTVPDAIGYRWNTSDNYESAIEMGTTTTKSEASLTCGTAYTRYVWAYNGCGNSTPVALTQSTLACWICGISTLTINHVAGPVAPVTKTSTYGTVTSIPGELTKCWITSNFGSDHQASAVNDATEASAGWYWQFNRKQGYKHDGSTRTPNTSWITSINENTNWTVANDPCALELGTGWRIPTNTEWTNVDASGVWNNWNGPWNSGLKIHAAGLLSISSGSLTDRGVNGYSWSSIQNGNSAAWSLGFGSAGSSPGSVNKSNGITIRCVRDY